MSARKSWSARMALMAFAASGDCWAGPYPPGPGGSGSDAVPAASPLFVAWAGAVGSLERGPQQAGTNAALSSYGTTADVLGVPDSVGATYLAGAPTPVCSLGDGGRITLTFSTPINDGEGPDFAVFENGFYTTSTAIFAELAFVEVSSNGVDFVRFPAVSLTQTSTQLGNFNTLDPTNVHNLAGKHPAGYGTPFDLAELAGSPGLDLQRITHVRLVDVVGDVKNGRGSQDSLGNWINDPWPTNFNTGGFDLDAVGVIHQAQEDWTQWLADPDADLDGDGRSNLVEWAVDSSPTTPDPKPPLGIRAEGNQCILTFTRAERQGLTLTVEQSVNGIQWNTIAAPAESGPVVVNVPRTGPASLYRLRIQRTP